MPELAYETKCRICGKWYRAQTDASAICHPCAEARIQELEKWREDAALGLGASRVEALREAREVLRLCAVKPAYPKSAPEYEPVRALCERHGYGAVMACASSQWMESLEHQGYPMDGAHVSGPCVETVTSTINLITRALGE